MIALILAVLSIVLFIMIGFFSSIYYSNTKQDQMAIDEILHFYTSRGVETTDNRNIFGKDKKLPMRPYFYLIVEDGEIIDFKKNMPSNNDMFPKNGEVNKKPLEEMLPIEIDYSKIYELIDGKENSGTIKYEDNYFLYDSAEVDNGRMYVFLDTTLTHSYFKNSIRTGILVLILTFLYILLIGRKILDKALDPLELSIENQKRFTGDASHELRTPLTAMRSNLDILINYDLSKEEQETWLLNISNEVERMTKLTNDLLLLSRNDVIVKEKDDFNLSEIFEKVYLSYQNICEINVRNGDFLVYGNREEMIQLIMIFIDNGIKYNSKENKKIDISAEMDKSHKHFTISISDNGDGIDSSKYDSIFERFYREDKARTSSQNGFGLGLSIAKNIINDYDGKVKIKSEINEGTTFKLILNNKK